ncbi:kelch-like protein 5 isoform X2 [Lingula anatina]|uniref:Kelch-like protein 5 isoform X2 n=2 Tax=Lingula anatina TaxID=7574 RepID=A0A1S3IN59_LINAN|nr:kelch-like protein 5 isoform X2 [Lingula anatina]|eukprot:XP_013399675.1 kelch-like protein 5 isoform X2 [Lingula anatina]
MRKGKYRCCSSGSWKKPEGSSRVGSAEIYRSPADLRTSVIAEEQFHGGSRGGSGGGGGGSRDSSPCSRRHSSYYPQPGVTQGGDTITQPQHTMTSTEVGRTSSSPQRIDTSPQRIDRVNTPGGLGQHDDMKRKPTGCSVDKNLSKWPTMTQLKPYMYLVHHTYGGYHCNRMEDQNTEDLYRSINHAERMIRKVEVYAQKRLLCDVVLLVGERTIPAHRLILSAASDYFAAMFTNDVREATQEEIRMKDVDSDALAALVQYMYTGRIELRDESVESLLSTACLLQLSEVVEACCGYLMKQLHPSNCLGIRQFADAQGCTDLYKVANNYVMENFCDVMQNQEFCELSADEVSKLLTNDDLNVPNEEMTFHALCTWAKHDMSTRKKYLSKLLANVKLPLLPPQFIADHVETNALFKEDRECQELIMEALKYHLLPERRHSLQSPRTKPRKSTVGVLYAVGGMDCTKGATSIEKYDFRANTWTQVANMNGRRLQFGVAVLEDKLFVVGGRDGLKTLNTVECYDPRKKTWSLMPPMSTHRHGLGVGVLEGPMYAVGGHDGWSYLNTVERWDPQARQWSYVAPMSTQRSTVGVTVMCGKLYAVGGRDGSSCLRSMECFDPHTNKWNLCAPMSKRRGGVGVASFNGFLYAVGGHDAPASNPTSSRFDCVERYDPKTDVWTTVAPISSMRDAVGMCALGDRLFCVGGYDGTQYLADVECYDPNTNEWTKVSPLCTGRAGACVVHIRHTQLI